MHKKLSTSLLILGLLALAGVADAQQNGSSTDLQFRSSILGSTQGALPFWLYANRDGKVDSGSTNWVNEMYVRTDLLDTERLSLEAGGNLMARISNEGSLSFNELYLQADIRGYRLMAGRFINPIGLNNHDLSVGSMMVSRNATPIPRISVFTPEFLDVPGLKGRLQYKGMFNHGWLEQARYVESPYIHQKYLYLRLHVGPFTGTAGIVHNVIWGGTHPDFGKLPQSFGDFLRVVAGRSASETSAAPGSDISNALGNSVAAYEFGLTYSREAVSVTLTRLFYLEDRVSTRFRSPWDGVWGINLRLTENSWLEALTYEHINTKQQDAKPGQPLGRANYYNNSIYRSGWTYSDRVLGTPLLLFNADRNRVVNNILVGHHLGLKGDISNNVSYSAKATYSRNYGDEYAAGEHLEQFSGYLGISYTLPGMEQLQVFTMLAADIGELYADNLGLNAGFKIRFP